MAKHQTSDATSFNDLIVAADMVDTIRNDERLVDHELGTEDRKKALKARLKSMYAAQGMDVSDSIIDEAVSKADAERFVHNPREPGLSRLLWTAYVRRGRIAMGATAALVGVGVMLGAYRAAVYQFVERPAIEAAANLEMQLNEVLPSRLKAVVSTARQSAETLDSSSAKAEIEAKAALVESALRARSVEDATAGIAALQSLANELKNEAARQAMLSSAKEIVRVENEKVASLNVEPDAREALLLKLSDLSSAAEMGRVSDFQVAQRSYNSLLTYVQSNFEVRIVDREGERSGVWRYWEPTGEKYYYLVVEALDRNGRAYPLEIKSVENGRVSQTATWAIRVPQRVYEMVGADKQADGVVDNPDAGIKPSGSLTIKWSVPTINDQRITAW